MNADAVFLSGYRAGWAARDAALLTEMNRVTWKATEGGLGGDECPGRCTYIHDNGSRCVMVSTDPRDRCEAHPRPSASADSIPDAVA